MSEIDKTTQAGEGKDYTAQIKSQQEEWDALGEDGQEKFMEQKEAIEAEDADDEESAAIIKEHLTQHNENKKNPAYLVRGAELMCSQGSNKRMMNLSPCHGVYIKAHAVVHELDCIQGDEENITWFGICTPGEELETEQIQLIGDDGKKCHGKKCKPHILGTWMESYDQTKIVDNGNKLPKEDGEIEGCNTLTMDSFLVCKHGGIIMPINSGQDREVGIDEFQEGWDAYRRVMGAEENKETQPYIHEVSDELKEAQSEDGLISWIPQKTTNEQVLKFMENAAFPLISESMSNEHYENNLKELKEQSMKDKGFYKRNAPIENQYEWGDIHFGWFDMDFSGCEIIAAYNAKVALGEEMTETEMAELICTFEKKGAVLSGGFGVAPTEINDYFEREGYGTEMITSMEKEDINAVGEAYDTVIITVFNSSHNIMDQIHTMNVSKGENGYVYHNGYKLDETKSSYIASEECDSLWEVITSVSGGDAKPISVIGINGKAEER